MPRHHAARLLVGHAGPQCGDDPAASSDHSLFAAQSGSPDTSAQTQRGVKALVGSVAVELAAGTIAGAYVVVRPLRVSPRGAAYSAYDPELNRKLVLRLLSNDGAQTLAGLRAWAKLRHPNVAALHDTGTLDGRLWIATEFVDGPTLATWGAESADDWRDVVDLHCDAGDALLAARSAGIYDEGWCSDDFRVGSDGRVCLTEIWPGSASAPGRPSDVDAFFDSLLGATGALNAGPPPAWLRYVCARRTERGGRRLSLDAAIRALRRGRHRTRRRRLWLGTIGSIALVAGALLVGEMRRRSRRAACVQEASAVATVWNDNVRTRVIAKLRAAAVPYAESTARQVGQQFDEFGAGWRGTKMQVCLAGLDAPESTPDDNARVSWCLEDRKRRFAALVVAMDQAGQSAAQHAASSAILLPDPTRCSDLSTLARLPPAPPLSRREAVSAVRADMAVARATGHVGGDVRALRMAATARFEAQSIGWDPLTAMALDLEAAELHMLGRPREARSRANAAYETAIAAGEWSVAAAAATRLAKIAGLTLHDLPLARAWSEQASVALGLAGDPDGSKAARLDANLGAALVDSNRFEEAEVYLNRAVRLRTLAFGDKHPRVASVLPSLGLAYHHQGKHDQAIGVLNRGLAIREASVGHDHPDLVATLINLAMAYDATRETAKSRAANLRALSIQEAAYGPEHPWCATIRLNLAADALAASDFDAAQAYLDEVDRHTGSSGGIQGWEKPRSLLIQARLFSVTGNDAGAQRAYREAIRLYEDSVGDGHIRVAAVLVGLGDSLERSGDYEASIEAHERALRIRIAALGPEHDLVAETLLYLATAERQSGDTENGAVHTFEALRIAEATLGPTNPRVASIHAILVGVHLERGEFELAERRARQALPVIEEVFGTRNPLVGSTLVNLARALLAQHRHEEALEVCERAVGLLSSAKSPQDGEAGARFILAQIIMAANRDIDWARREATASVAGWRAAGRAEDARSVQAWIDEELGGQ